MGGIELSSIRQISNLHKQIRYRMKAKLKVPKRLSNKKYPAAAIKFKKN
jgi:putative transposase